MAELRAPLTSFDYVLDNTGKVYGVTFTPGGQGSLLPTNFPMARDVRHLKSCLRAGLVQQPNWAYGYLTTLHGELLAVSTEGLSPTRAKQVLLDKGWRKFTIEVDDQLYYRESLSGQSVLLPWSPDWPTPSCLTDYNLTTQVTRGTDAKQIDSLIVHALLVFAGGEIIFSTWQGAPTTMTCEWFRVPDVGKPLVMTGDLRRGIHLADDQGAITTITESRYTTFSQLCQRFTFYEVNANLPHIVSLEHSTPIYNSPGQLVIRWHGYVLSTTIWGIIKVTSLGHYHLVEDRHNRQYLLNLYNFTHANSHGTYHAVNTLPAGVWTLVPEDIWLVSQTLTSEICQRLLRTKSSRAAT